MVLKLEKKRHELYQNIRIINYNKWLAVAWLLHSIMKRVLSESNGRYKCITD